VALCAAVGLSLALRGESFSIAQTVQVVVNAAAEETTFRVALPVLIFAGLVRWLGHGSAAVTATVMSAVAFLTAPGHLHQVGATDQQLLVAISFVAAAAMWSAVLWTTGALVAVMANHAALNLLTGLAEDGYLRSAEAMGLRYGVTALMLAVAFRQLVRAGRAAPTWSAA
jgi:membrane protease YdiL (CAAX protease family)